MNHDGQILFGNLTNKKLLEHQNQISLNDFQISVSDPISFWAWRKICLWKDDEENKTLKVLKSILATPAFLGIGVGGILETITCNALTRILKTASKIMYCWNNRREDPLGAFWDTDNQVFRALYNRNTLCEIATAESFSSLITNCFTQRKEEEVREKIAKSIVKIDDSFVIFKRKVIGFLYKIHTFPASFSSTIFRLLFTIR